jgi:hypothetical protein
MSEEYEDGAGVAFPHVTRDAFGVPSNVIGVHPEKFFSLLGRIVALSALLENRVLVFYQYLVGGQPDRYTDLGVGKLICRALKEIAVLGPADRKFAEEFLEEAKVITEKRNHYVHNLWSPQGGGSLFGWRTPRKKNAPAALTMATSLDEMRADLRRLVDLLNVKRLNSLLGLVAGGSHLRNDADE